MRASFWTGSGGSVFHHNNPLIIRVTPYRPVGFSLIKETGQMDIIRTARHAVLFAVNTIGLLCESEAASGIFNLNRRVPGLAGGARANRIFYRDGMTDDEGR